ncbi:MAG: tryptophan--tRNA ligase, partial [Alphaproteobacteria bacterium]|nr:tryptophan--tRNA ligase [Alphaproteobacteria bacterium]
NLTDDADTIAQKFKKAKSDMVEGDIGFDDARPEANNLLTIYAALKGVSKEQAVADVKGLQFSAFKQLLTDVAVAHLSPITAKMCELLADQSYIDSVLKDGSQRADAVAQKTLDEVKDIVGFLRL